MIDTMQHPMTPIIAAKFAILKPLLDEQARRLWAAVEARALGRGGISQVAEATGLSRATVRAGLQELAPPATATGLQTPPGRLRRPGGGRQAPGATCRIGGYQEERTHRPVPQWRPRVAPSRAAREGQRP